MINGIREKLKGAVDRLNVFHIFGKIWAGGSQYFDKRAAIALVCGSMQLAPTATFAATPVPPPTPTTHPITTSIAPKTGPLSTTSTLSGTTPSTTSTVAAATLPAQGTITSSILSAAGSITNSQTLVIDISKLATPGTVSFAGSFNNAGNVYLVSSSNSYTTATLSAAQIYNHPGALITTILPQGGLAGYLNLVSGLHLNLVATNFIANSGVISSTGNLSMTAPQIINALPSGVAASAPQLAAAGNINLVTNNLANAGTITAVQNLNINSIAGANLTINNVGGVLAALNGNINVTTSLTDKTNLSILGGTLSAQQLNMITGTGLLDLQVDKLNGMLNVTAGDGFISTNSSSIALGNVQFSGDPIVNSGGEIIFEADSGSSICTGGGTLNGTDAIADCSEIETGGFTLNLSGSANLNVPIVSSGSIVINAGTGITTGTITTPFSVTLNSTAGNIQTGDIQTGGNGVASFVSFQTLAGSITTGNLNLGGTLFVNSAGSFTAGSVNVTGGAGVGIAMVVNQSTPFVVGGSGVGAVASMVLSNNGPNTVLYIRNAGTGGITINPSSFGINAPNAFAELALDAGPSGAITFGPGTISLDKNSTSTQNVIALSAGTINANNTTLSANNSVGQAGAILIGANTINTGSGLTLNANGILGDVFIGGTGAVSSSVTPFPFAPPQTTVQTTWNGSTGLPLAVSGSSLTATSNGLLGQVLVNASTMNLSVSNLSLHADGNGLGFAGFVQVAALQITGSPTFNVTANGSGSDSGGIVNIQTINPGTNLTIGQGSVVSATGGPAGGNGGQVVLGAGGLLSVNSASINASALGGNGSGGLVSLVGGTPGIAGGGVVFTDQSASITNNGQGSGTGGTVQVGAFGTDNNLTLPTITANGGATGSGGEVDAQAGNNLTTSGAIHVDAGASGNGSGGIVSVHAGTGSGTGSLTVAGDVTAKGGNAAGNGGYIDMDAFGDVTVQPALGSPSVNVKAEGGDVGGSGGTIFLQAGHNLTLTNAVVSVESGHSGMTGSGGYLEIDAGLLGAGDLNATATLNANGSQFGGTVIVDSYQGNATFNQPAGGIAVSASGGNSGGQTGDGGFLQIQTFGNLNLLSGSIDVSSYAENGNGGTINLIAGTGGSGALTYNDGILANAGAVAGNGGNITFMQASINPMQINGNIQANGTSANNIGGNLVFQNNGSSDFNLVIAGSEVADDTGTVLIQPNGHNVTATITGKVDAGQLNSNLGSVSFLNSANVLVQGTGQLDGLVSLSAQNITFLLTGPKTNTLNFGNLNATTDINLYNGNSQINLLGAVTASGNVSLNTSQLKSLGTITAQNITVSYAPLFIADVPASTNNFLLGNITASNSISIVAKGVSLGSTINQVNGAVWSAPAISLGAQAGGSIGGFGIFQIQLSTNFLTANSTGNIFISNNKDLTVGASSGGNLVITGQGNITISDFVTATNSLSLTSSANNGGIFLDQQIIAPNIACTANGTGVISQTAGTITATNLILSSNSGNIKALLFMGLNGTVNVSTTGSASLSNASNSFYTVTAHVGPLFSFTDTGGGLPNFKVVSASSAVLTSLTDMTVGSVEVDSLSLVSVSGNIVATGPIIAGGTSITAGGSVAVNLNGSNLLLNVHGSASIFRSSDTTMTLSPSTVGGDLLLQNQGNLTINGPILVGGNLYLNNVGDVTQNGSIIVTGQVTTIGIPANTLHIDPQLTAASINLTAVNGIFISGTGGLTTTNGSLTLATLSGPISIGPGIALSATGGNLVIENDNLVSGNIFIGAGAKLSAFSNTAGLGNISVTIGPAPLNPVVGPIPANTSIQGSNAFFGANGITALCCNNSINATSASVTFNTGVLPASAIILGGAVSVSASVSSGIPPGHGSSPPGQGGSPPGLTGTEPPGLGGSGIPPGQSRIPPGQTGTPPGSLGTPGTPTQKNSKNGSTQTSTTTSNSTLVPVGFEERPGGSIGLAAYSCSDTLIEQLGSVDLSVDKLGTIVLEDGEILLNSTRPILVKTPSGNLSVGARAILTIRVDRVNGEVIRVLYDNHNGSAVMSFTSGQSVKIGVGEELAIGSISVNGVSHRNIELLQSRASLKLIRSEFSLASLTSSGNVVSAVLLSKLSENRKIRNKIIKTAAALSIINSRHGAFVNFDHKNSAI